MMAENLTSEQQRLWEYLSKYCRGKQNAREQKALAVWLRISERMIRKHTAALAEAGYPVASTVHPPYGIYIPVTSAEKEEYIAQLRARIRALARRIRALGQSLTDEEIQKLQRGEIPEQLEMNI